MKCNEVLAVLLDVQGWTMGLKVKKPNKLCRKLSHMYEEVCAEKSPAFHMISLLLQIAWKVNQEYSSFRFLW